VTSSNTPAAISAIRSISREELLEKLERDDRFRLVMALNEWAFRAKHIPGSEHFNTADELLASLALDDDIVVYCTNVDCHASIALYDDLVARGYQHVRRYHGGLTDWEAAGLPLEGDWVHSETADPG
jgi:rhodanese-related sulfurtransferase